ncbi:hypothetical protein Ciccas_013938 [Cichlidogyrus casuarinus]|uniref:Uncharacterized protein n=1 Tax=Cichlidogyrus casuarinus TaxID=1844966 RepID=A0ABD2PJC2_9PLAT
METLYLAVLISLLWDQTKSQNLKQFCLPGDTTTQCLAKCKATDCVRALDVISQMNQCFQNSLTTYVNGAVNLPTDRRKQIINFIRTDIRNLENVIGIIMLSLPFAKDPDFEKLIGNVPPSITSLMVMAWNIVTTADIYQTGFCSDQITQFRGLLTQYALTDLITTTTTTRLPCRSHATLLRRSSFLIIIVLAAFSTIL